ncbi:MAG: hypothetical protein LBV67_06555 [Streptococcaceae bacterium]|jgi:predicted nuclease with TOPRIM domain|nr:hypothetical protein [Streptococcaceae bacterium]
MNDLFGVLGGMETTNTTPTKEGTVAKEFELLLVEVKAILKSLEEVENKTERLLDRLDDIHEDGDYPAKYTDDLEDLLKRFHEVVDDLELSAAVGEFEGEIEEFLELNLAMKI